MQGNAAVTIRFGTGNFSTAKTAGAGDLDSFCTQAHGTAYALFHGTAESDTAFQLASYVFSNEGSVHIGGFDLDDVDVQFAVSQFSKILLEELNIAALTANDNTRFSRVDGNTHLLFGSFDGYTGNASLELFIFNEFTDFDIFQKIFLIVFVGEPLGIPIIDYANPKTMWINFLTHYSFPPSDRMIIFRIQQQSRDWSVSGS